MPNRRAVLKGMGAATIVGSIAGCSGSEAGTDEPYVDGKIRFLMSPSEPQDRLRAQYTPIKERLNDHVDAVDTVEMQYADNYAATLSALDSGTGDIAETGPFAGALGVTSDNAEILLQRWGYGAWTYTSVIVTRPDTDIEDLTDLEDKTIGFADPLSASGSLYPLGMLKEAGLSVPDEPGTPAGADFTPQWSTHGQAFEALQAGTVDAAGVGYFIVADDEREGYVDGVEEVARDDGIPRAPVMVSPQLTDEEKSSIQTAFTEAPDDIYYGEDGEEGTEDDLWFSKVRPADKSTYQPVIDKANTLGYGADVFES
ncbi:PhnD/SsuA/transferrin family substrate-binding protein [Halapricum sp. CBA1109]|uniref:phosphate/phosphite/phosphonate ABC transporter substrate-binding protein n=1 Tax=Halapricum sp. CBA1109 TaxID=2668068 RepID=UPI0012FB6503|nr:phosphate/phosphite/phosphonate ABC transporter substrate-binding protein [Halapricum sp. CBA1109]MUV89655.1 PhnD/SsuA/transferrin family substrate-binding protein [Halapricum sp. CBA1109]